MRSGRVARSMASSLRVGSGRQFNIGDSFLLRAKGIAGDMLGRSGDVIGMARLPGEADLRPAGEEVARPAASGFCV